MNIYIKSLLVMGLFLIPTGCEVAPTPEQATVTIAPPSAEPTPPPNLDTDAAVINVLMRQVEAINKADYQAYLDTLEKNAYFIKELESIQSLSIKDLKLNSQLKDIQIETRTESEAIVTYTIITMKREGKDPFQNYIAQERTTLNKRNGQWLVTDSKTISQKNFGGQELLAGGSAI